MGGFAVIQVEKQVDIAFINERWKASSMNF